MLIDAVKMKSLIALIAETRATAAWRHASPPEVVLSPNSILYLRRVTTFCFINIRKTGKQAKTTVTCIPYYPKGINRRTNSFSIPSGSDVPGTQSSNRCNVGKI